MAVKMVDDRQQERPFDLEKDALIVQSEAAPKSEDTPPSGHLKYLLAVSLALLYFVVPLPAVLSAGSYLSASSSSALSSLLDFSFSSSSVSSSPPCHYAHRTSSHGIDNFASHARGYGAIFGIDNHHHHTENTAKGRSPRDDAYNSKIEQAFLKVPNNESCIAASRR